ncbi:MAG: DUF1700 domain-containing protein [Pauljensenia sp.]
MGGIVPIQGAFYCTAAKTDYLAALEKYLKTLPEADYKEAMDYFTEYFEEAGPENEAQVIEELGVCEGEPVEDSLVVLGRVVSEGFEEATVDAIERPAEPLIVDG